MTDWISKNNPCTGEDTLNKFDVSSANDSLCVAVLKNPNEFYEKINPDVISSGSIITKAKYVKKKTDYSENTFHYVIYSVANDNGDHRVLVNHYIREIFGEYKWEYCHDCDYMIEKYF